MNNSYIKSDQEIGPELQNAGVDSIEAISIWVDSFGILRILEFYFI